MKYLKDEQLTQLTKLQAKNRLLQGKGKASEKTALLQKILKAEDESTPNVTTVGMSPNDLTFATKRYLEKHGLLDGSTAAGGGSASDSTQNDSYRLRTNYSTMTSGSEDSPAHVTHEVLGTPSSRRTDTLEYVTPTSGRHMDGQFSNKTTPGYDTTSTRTYNDTGGTYNDSRQSVGYQGTPKPNGAQSRVGEHRRFTPNGTNGHNSSVPQSHNTTPYSHNASPGVHNIRRDAGDMQPGVKGRYASPLVTPAPNYQNQSPPERDQNTPQGGRLNHQSPNWDNGAANAGYDRQAYGVRKQPETHTENANQFPGRQYKEETNDDDRILDITRLKQLPKLL